VEPGRWASPKLVHGDLGPAHLLCRPTHGLVAVIDWSDARLGDPATDLAWLLHGLDGRLSGPLLDRLDVDDPALDRARLRHQLGPWWEVLHGLDQYRPDLVRRGLEGVRDRL
jgi:aminoglycoside phosphotransferase (APT) family kinase protein